MSTFIFIAGLFSGFLDAVAGGGGLIMLPAVMLTGLPINAAIATNKLCGVSAVIASSTHFARTKNVNWRFVGWMGIPAVVGALIGSQMIGYLSKDLAQPVIITLLIGITLFAILKPNFGIHVGEKVHLFKLSLFGFLIGFHDGFFGPGTGIFLVFALLSFGALDFLKGTGTTKVINLMTNAAAIFSFLWLGIFDLKIGLAGACGTVIGSFFGARAASKHGVRFIRPIFIAVSVLMIAKLLWGYLQG